MATLRDLGLSEYETRAYRTLLRTGATTAKELSDASGVPTGRIYDVLDGLESNGLVRVQTAGRPKKYVAVEPEAALDRLLEAKTRELEAQASQYERVVEELQRELDAGPVDDEFWTAALGPDETVELFLERLDAARERIVMVAAMPSAGFDLGEVSDRTIDRLEAATDRGVSVSLLVSPDVVENIPEQTWDRYANGLATRERFSVRASEDVDGTFTVLDGNEVCIEVPNPLDSDRAFAMIDLQSVPFARDVRSAFEARWGDAESV